MVFGLLLVLIGGFIMLWGLQGFQFGKNLKLPGSGSSTNA